jgi:flagellar protein FliS
MFLATHARATNAYRQVSTATQVNLASGPQLVTMLFDALRVQLLKAENALAQDQMPEKGLAIGHAVRIIEEGLRSGLDMRRGGELSQSLNDLYVYCAKTLTEANFYNDVSKVREVASLIETVAGAWKQVAAGTSVQ